MGKEDKKDKMEDKEKKVETENPDAAANAAALESLIKGTTVDVAATSRSTYTRRREAVHTEIKRLISKVKRLWGKSDAVQGTMLLVDKYNSKVHSVASHPVLDLCT